MKSYKTKKLTKINDKTVIATLDIGNTFQHGYFRAPNGNDIEPFAFYNSKKSYNAFWTKLVRDNSQYVEEYQDQLNDTHYNRSKKTTQIRNIVIMTRRKIIMCSDELNKGPFSHMIIF